MLCNMGRECLTMIRLLGSLAIFLALASCASGQPLLAQVNPTAVSPVASISSPATQEVDTATLEPSITAAPPATATSTPHPFLLQFTHDPSQTPLPTLQLPTTLLGRALQ